VLDPIGDHLDGQPLGVADGFLARLPVGHHAGEFQRLGNPAAVIFPVDVNGKVHHSIVSPARYRSPPINSRFVSSACGGATFGTSGMATRKQTRRRPSGRSDRRQAALYLKNLRTPDVVEFAVSQQVGQAAPPAPPAKLSPSKGMAQPIFPARQELQGDIRSSEFGGP